MPSNLALSTAPLLTPGDPREASQAQYSTGTLSCNTTPFRKIFFLSEWHLVMNFCGEKSFFSRVFQSNHSVLIPSIILLRVKIHRMKLCLQLLTQGPCLDSATSLFSRWSWVTCPGSRSWTMLGTYWGIGLCGWSHARAWWMLYSNNQGFTDLQKAIKTQTSACFFTPGSS